MIDNCLDSQDNGIKRIGNLYSKRCFIVYQIVNDDWDMCYAVGVVQARDKDNIIVFF